MSGNEDLIDFNSSKNILTEGDVIEVVKKINGDTFKQLIEFRLEDYSQVQNGYIAIHNVLM